MNPRPLPELGYSIRRHYVDQFHFRRVSDLPAGSFVLDLGGNRIAKRGLFDIDKYAFTVIYADLTAAKRPHVQTDAASLPFRDDRLDAVICSEMLEHVPSPGEVLREIHRVLRRHGTVLICVPFLMRIHGDPYDYGRYTDFFWQELLAEVGFTDVEIEHQGGFWSVLVDMIRDLAYKKAMEAGPKLTLIGRVIAAAVGPAKVKAVEWDAPDAGAKSRAPGGYTTGFGIRARKR